MNNKKHVPGPWSVSGVGPTRLIYKSTDTSVYPVAVVELDNLKRFGSGDIDCTASLISAAPELLFVTKRTLELFAALEPVFKLIDPQLVDQVREIEKTIDLLISKAEGYK